MSAATTDAPRGAPSGALSSGTIGVLLRYGGLFIVDAFALLLIYMLAADGVWELAVFIAIVTIIVNIINLREDLKPLRWISPALALMALFVIYPIIYTVYVAFTNYGDGNFYPKGSLVNQLLEMQFVPDDGVEYDYTAYRNEAGEYALWLTDADGKHFFITVGNAMTPATLPENGELPESYEGYTLLPNSERFRALQDLENIAFGEGENLIGIRSGNAVASKDRYAHDAAADTLTDLQSGVVYTGDDSIGFFVDKTGYEAALAADTAADIQPFLLANERFSRGAGYRILVGLNNFERFFTSPALNGPLLRIFLWTVTFALLSVITTFSVGLLIALLLQANTPGKRFFRTLLIVPYAIPALISVSVWKGMLNDNFGVVSNFLESILNTQIPFFSDPVWAKVGILLINLWLGYPYFMLVCSGALAAIPSDMYEAAKVDGANTWQQFQSLTLPMLLVAVGPLLIASFTYNFNNFVLIEAYNEGGPPIFGTPTPAGHTDILISYAFRLAFGTGRGADYGLASAITIVIFAMVVVVTLFQFRFTGSWEETSKNV